MKQTLLIFFLLSIISIPLETKAQNFTEPLLRAKLDSLSITSKGLNNTFQLNVSGLPLSELVNSIALENNLNISIDPVLNNSVSYNFFDARVKDVLVFLYEHFDVEYRFVGNILAINKREARKEIPQPIYSLQNPKKTIQLRVVVPDSNPQRISSKQEFKSRKMNLERWT